MKMGLATGLGGLWAFEWACQAWQTFMDQLIGIYKTNNSVKILFPR